MFNNINFSVKSYWTISKKQRSWTWWICFPSRNKTGLIERSWFCSSTLWHLWGCWVPPFATSVTAEKWPSGSMTRAYHPCFIHFWLFWKGFTLLGIKALRGHSLLLFIHMKNQQPAHTHSGWKAKPVSNECTKRWLLLFSCFWISRIIRLNNILLKQQEDK